MGKGGTIPLKDGKFKRTPLTMQVLGNLRVLTADRKQGYPITFRKRFSSRRDFSSQPSDRCSSEPCEIIGDEERMKREGQ